METIEIFDTRMEGLELYRSGVEGFCALISMCYWLPGHRSWRYPAIVDLWSSSECGLLGPVWLCTGMGVEKEPRVACFARWRP